MQCNKVFRNTALASFHGEKSGHDQFEESTEEVDFIGAIPGYPIGFQRLTDP